MAGGGPPRNRPIDLRFFNWHGGADVATVWAVPASPRLLLPLVVCALVASAAAASPAPVALPHELAAAQRNLSGELKAAQQQVDGALKLRKQRLEAWQKAVAARDAAAAAVAAKKRAHDVAGLEAAQQKTFALDEEATRARSALAGAEAGVAKGGAELLSLYDALLAERRRAVDAAAGSARRAAVQGYRDLAAQRDAVRQALLPLLSDATPAAAAAPGADLEPRADDDVETLLEKADLARDLEQRLNRQMEAVHRRISELEEEQAVAKDVAGMVGRNALFDEEDRRLLVVRTETTTRTVNNGPVAAIGGRSDENADPGEAPPAAGGFEGEPTTDTDDVGGGAPPPDPGPPPSIAPPPPTVVSSTTTLRTEQALAVPATSAGLQGMLSSSTNLSSLKALEKQLQANAVKARDKAKKLRVEAERRQ